MKYKDAMDAYLIIEDILDIESALKEIEAIGPPKNVEIGGGEGKGDFRSKNQELSEYLGKQTRLFLESKISFMKEELDKIGIEDGKDKESIVDVVRGVK